MSTRFGVPVAVAVASGLVIGGAFVMSGASRTVLGTGPNGVFVSNPTSSTTHVAPGGPTATVPLPAAPVGEIQIVQQPDGSAMIVDEGGRTSRVDAVNLEVTAGVQLRAGASIEVGDETAYAVDRAAGTVHVFDPQAAQTRGEPVQVGGDLGDAVVGADDVLWVVDRDTGEVVGVDGSEVVAREPIAEPGDDVQLALVDGRVVAVNPRRGVLTVVTGDRAGATYSVSLSGSAQVPGRVEAGDVLPVLGGDGALQVVDVGSGEARRIELGTGGRRLTDPIVTGGHVYLADRDAGMLLIVDLGTGEVATVELTGEPGRFELVADGDWVVVNDPDSEQVWSIAPDGTISAHEKFDADDADATTEVSIPLPPNADPSTTSTPSTSTTVPESTTSTTSQPPDRPPPTRPPDVTIPPAPTAAPPGQTTTTTTTPESTTEPPTASTSTTVPLAIPTTDSRSSSTTEAPLPPTEPPVPTTDVPAPPEPSGVDVAAGDRAVDVEWEEAAGDVDHYYLEVRRSGDDDAVLSRAYPERTTSASLRGLTNGTDYYVAVQASGPGGDSAFSFSSVFTPFGPPDPPTNLQADTGPTEATVTWEQVSPSNGTTVIGWDVTVDDPDVVVGQVDGERRVTLTQMAADATYTVTLVALGDNDLYSDPVELQFRTDPEPLPPPSDVGCVAGDGTITASWSPVPGASGYVASLSPSGESQDVAIEEVTFAGLTNETEYTVVVRAADANGDLSPPEACSATPTAPPTTTTTTVPPTTVPPTTTTTTVPPTTVPPTTVPPTTVPPTTAPPTTVPPTTAPPTTAPPTTAPPPPPTTSPPNPPGQPRNPSLSSQGDTLVATWDAPGGGGAPTQYRVRLHDRTAGGGGPQVVVPASQLSATFSDVTCGHWYELRVSAINGDGESQVAYHDGARACPPPPTTTTTTTTEPPGPPTATPAVNVEINEPKGFTARGSWSTVADADYYEVQWNSDTTWVRVDGTTSTGLAVEGTNCERHAELRVRAVNEHGAGPVGVGRDFAMVDPPPGEQCQ